MLEKTLKIMDVLQREQLEQNDNEKNERPGQKNQFFGTQLSV